MGLFDRLKQALGGPSGAEAPAAAASPRAEEARGGFVGGSSEPDPRNEPWPLTVTRSLLGAISLDYVSPSQRQTIHGIHERLRPFVSRLPDGTELSYLCRVAEGTHYNVLNLIAVKLVEPQEGLLRVVGSLDDGFVRERPYLLVARAQERLQQRDDAGAAGDLREALAIVGPTAAPTDFPGLDRVWEGLPAAQKASLITPYAAWVARGPLVTKRALALDLAYWSEPHVVQAAEEAFREELPYGGSISIDALVAELTRRGSSHAARFTQSLAHRAELKEAADPKHLEPSLLARVLETRSREAVAIWADALSEKGHPYGEFLALHLKGGAASLRKAKKLAADAERTWLGPLAAIAKVLEYEHGLPIAVELVGNPPRSFDLAAACAHPMLGALRKLSRHKTKKTRRCDVDAGTFEPFARATVPLALTHLDCGEECLAAIADLDCRSLTHLSDLDVLEDLQALTPRAFAGVRWVEVHIAAGDSARSLETIAADRTGFFAKVKPALDLFFLGGASVAGLERVQLMRPKLHGCALTIGGEPLA